jgi:hypothetical protein
MLEHKIFEPYYIKANNRVTVGFILSLLFCSKIKSIERKIIYFFYICNVIPNDVLKYEREKLNKESLLQLIFELTYNKKYIKKKDLRLLTKLEDRGTFNKYFDEHLTQLGLKKNTSFTLYETFKILQFWQGDDKWGRMEAFSKRELAKHFMNDKYDELELKMTEDILAIEVYKHHDFIKPADAKKFFNKVLHKESLQLLYEEEYNTDYLYFFFLLYLFFGIKS